MVHLIGIVGPLRSGKTTFASLLPWLIKNEVEMKGGHIELFANYDLLGARRLERKEDWYAVAEAHGSVCVWDEAHIHFDSRRFSKFENNFATHLLTYVGKMAAIQVFATPSIKRLDTRIREILEILIVVRKGNAGTHYDFYDYQADYAGPFGKYLHTKFLPSRKRAAVHALNLFDTHSFVTGFPLPKNETEARRFMSELEAAHERGRRKSEAIKIEHKSKRARPSKSRVPGSQDTGVPVPVHR